MLLNVDDYREAARLKLPAAVFAYLETGAGDDITLERNRTAFAEIALRPRVLVDATERSLATEVLGTPTPVPFLLGPTAGAEYMHPDAELAVARAAGRAGLIYALSTHSSHPLEDVAAATTSPKWFQLYTPPTRPETDALIDRAADAGYSALILTVDVPDLGLRERARRTPIEFEASPRLPSMNRFVSPADLSAVRERWAGPLLVKGIHTAQDAVLAVDLGADAVVVSNHGGRQLDGVLAGIEILPEVVAAVGDRVQVLLDSGIRRGTDIVKALALGARAVLVGRPYLYGLAAAGEAGVSDVIDLLTHELDNTFALLGATSVRQIGDHTIQLLPGFAGRRPQ